MLPLLPSLLAAPSQVVPANLHPSESSRQGEYPQYLQTFVLNFYYSPGSGNGGQEESKVLS